jgi:hypothetical protein
VITMNNRLKLENRIKYLKANGKDNGNIIRKLIRKLRKPEAENNG